MKKNRALDIRTARKAAAIEWLALGRSYRSLAQVVEDQIFSQNSFPRSQRDKACTDARHPKFARLPGTMTRASTVQ
jgi:hypothetical protein